jgi:transporter family-2 protein
VAGALTALQSHVNGELSVRLGNGSQAAVISFSSGFLILCLLLFVIPPMRRGLWSIPEAVRRHELSRWQLLGGVGGAFFVAVQTVIVPTIGVALFTVSVVAGLTVNSLYVDRLGLGPTGRTAITPRRIAAAAISIIAVLVSVSDKLGAATFSLIAIVAGVAAGAVIAAQQALNGRVSAVTKSPLTAAWINFAVGTTVLATVLTVRTAAGGPAFSGVRQSWWLYTGGTIGIVFISLAALVIGHLGVLLFSLCQVAGQVLGAVAIDQFLPTNGETITAATLLGAVLTLFAVVVGAGLLRRLRLRIQR